jgi:hypothetical protein
MDEPVKATVIPISDGPIRCDGDVLFGFTVKACDKPATRRLWQDEREVYWFCEEHYQKAIQGTTEEVQP